MFISETDTLHTMRIAESAKALVEVASITADRIPADSPSPPSLTEIASDGRYFYVLYPPSNVLAFSFNGLNFTFLRAYTNPPFSLATFRGGEILTLTAAAAGTGYGPSRVVMLGTQTGMKALSFDGTNFSEIYTQFGLIREFSRLATDGTYIY